MCVHLLVEALSNELVEIDVYQKTQIPTLRRCERPATRERNLFSTTLSLILHQLKKDLLKVSILRASQNDASDVTS